jgi:hypothetical protein
MTYDKQYYIKSIKEISKKNAESWTTINGIMNTNQNPGKWTDKDREAFTNATEKIESTYQEAVRLSPPPELDQLHKDFLEGFQKLADSMPLLREGLIKSDLSKLLKATSLISSGAKILEKSDKELESMKMI